MKNFISHLYLALFTLGAFIISLSSVGFSAFAFISVGFYLTLFALFFFITGKIKSALLTASSMIVIIQLLNQLKIHFYKERLFFPDIFISLDPDNFEVLLHYPIALLAIVGLMTLFIVNLFIFHRSKTYTFKWRLISLFTAILSFTTIMILSQNRNLIEHWESHLPKGRGTITNLFLSAQKSAYTAPIFGDSSQTFLKAPQPDNTNPKVKPDIVVFLQESAFNPSGYNLPEQALPKLAQFDDASSVIAQQALRVETYGGGTWLSEFSLLTGLNSGDFSFRKNAVFYTIVPHVKTNLFRELKQNGYFTVVLTPMNDMNYNAGNAYRHLGVDLILQPQDLGYQAPATQNLWHIPTQEMLNYAKTLLEQYTDKPLLIYVLSMFEHGPYDDDHPDTHHLATYISDRAMRGRMNDYINRIQALNAATLDFDRYLEHRQKPSLFLYFGDHQPAMGWQETYRSHLARPDFLTQYTLSAHHLPVSLTRDTEVTDIAFLGGLVLEATNAEVTPFYQANIKMRHLCQGKLLDCENKDLVDSYKYYIYQELKNAGE